MASVNLNTTSSLLPTTDTKTKDKSSIAQEFEQLEQDISSGSVSAAQQDYVTLKSELPATSSASSTTSASATDSSSQSNTLDQLFSQLGADLNKGDLSAARQDFSQIKDQLGKGHHGAHPSGPPPSSSSASTSASSASGSSSTSSTTETDLQKLLEQLESSINGGDTTTASSTLMSLQQAIAQPTTYSASSVTTGTNVDTYA